MDINCFETPLAVLDIDILEENIKDMAIVADTNNVTLRPMVKTHKSPEIALKQMECGSSGITVATLDEAEIMLGAGIKDIFIAYEIIGPARIKRLLQLAKNADISVAVDSIEGAVMLEKQLKKEDIVLDYLIEIDSGLNRCGVEPGQPALELAEKVDRRCSYLNLKGIFTHAGQVYGVSEPAEVEKIGHYEGQVMGETAELFRQHNRELDIVSVGSTPTVKYSAANSEVTEIRPGNYVFYDNIQLGLDIAEISQIALSIHSTVISCPTSKRAIIDAGSKTLNLDKGAHGTELVKGFGLVIYNGEVREDLVIDHLSEEHGYITIDDSQGIELKVGDRLEIIPNHSCAVANLFNKLAGIKDGKFEKFINVKARRQITL